MVTDGVVEKTTVDSELYKSPIILNVEVNVACSVYTGIVEKFVD